MIEDMIITLTDYLYKGKGEIQYKGIEFPIQEIKYASPVDYKTMVRIGIMFPCYLNMDPNGGIHTVYEISEGAKETHMVRVMACKKLATHFVMNILPKIDHQLNTIIHNEEVEKILDVLD